MPSDPSGSFRTHSNYIEAFRTAVLSQLASDKIFVRPADELARIPELVRSSHSFASLQQRHANISQIERHLTNAWGTELLLALSGELASRELLGFANHWGVVQAYYAAYHATLALAAATGSPPPSSHAAGRRFYSNFWTSQVHDLPPWSFGYLEGAAVNAPPERAIEDIHPWTTCDPLNCWSLLAKAFKTTREDDLRDRRARARDGRQQERRRAWKSEEERRLAEGRKPRVEPHFGRPMLTEEEKRKIDRRLLPTTILDYLWRLRVRSNYEDATMFTEGPAFDQESGRVHENLRLIVSSTLLAIELIIEKLVGAQTFAGVADKWLKNPTANTAPAGLSQRRELLG